MNYGASSISATRHTVTHIYLLMGCALPHGLSLILKHDGADCLVLKLGRVAVLGCGDALARYWKTLWHRDGSQETCWIGASGRHFCLLPHLQTHLPSRGQLVGFGDNRVLEATVRRGQPRAAPPLHARSAPSRSTAVSSSARGHDRF